MSPGVSVEASRTEAAGRWTLRPCPVIPVPGGRGKALRTGFVVGVTNPKTIVFFVAFLPQFVNASAGHVGAQMAMLGATFGTLAICSDSVWALVASKGRDWFARKPNRLDRLGVTGGVMMVGLGATMLTQD